MLSKLVNDMELGEMKKLINLRVDRTPIRHKNC